LIRVADAKDSSGRVVGAEAQGAKDMTGRQLAAG
jgi:hypothetical protein